MSKFSKEMEEKFMLEMQDINIDEQQSQLQQSYYQIQRKQLQAEINKIQKANNYNEVLEEIKKNVEGQKQMLNSYEEEIQELHSMNKDNNVIKQEQMRNIRDKLQINMNNNSVKVMEDERMNIQFEKERQIYKRQQEIENIKICQERKEYQQELRNKLQIMNEEKQIINMGKQDELSKLYQQSIQSDFFKERFIHIHIGKVKENDCEIEINSCSKIKNTFTNLKPLMNCEENIMPKNSPQIALRNLKKMKKNGLKKPLKQKIQVSLKKIQFNSQQINIQNKINIQKSNINKITYNNQLQNLIINYIKQYKNNFKQLEILIQSYKPKILKNYLQENQKNSNIDITDLNNNNNNNNQQRNFSQIISQQQQQQNIMKQNLKLKQLKMTLQGITNIIGISSYKAIQYVSLQFNQLKDINQIRYCDNLIEVNLQHNKIKNCSVIAQLNWLRFINLEYNEISQIKQWGKSLQVAYFGYNRIQEVHNAKNSPHLHKLRLNNNKLHSIQGLENLYLLEELNVSRNMLQNIIGLQKCCLLRKLDVSNNRIINFGYKMIHLYLNELNVNNNNLNQLKSMFLPSLQKLYLIKNKLIKLNNSKQKIIIYLPYLKELNIDNNKLQGFSLIFYLIQYSHYLQILRYNDNEYFLSLRQKNKQIFQYIICKNIENIKILNQDVIQIGLKKYYQQNYSIYLTKKLFFKPINHILKHFQKNISFLLKQNIIANQLKQENNNFIKTNIFIENNSITKINNMMNIIRFLQNKQNYLLIQNEASLFYLYDQYEKKLRISQHKIKSMLIRYQYKKLKKIKYYQNNQNKIIKICKELQQIQQKMKIRQIIRCFEQNMKIFDKNKAALQIQKIWKGYRIRNRYKKLLQKYYQNNNDDSFQMQQIDLNEFDNYKKEQFNFELPQNIFESYIIKPQVFMMLQNKKMKQQQSLKNNNNNNNKKILNNSYKKKQQLQQQYKQPKKNNFIQQKEERNRQKEQQQQNFKKQKMKQWNFEKQSTYQVLMMKKKMKEERKRKQDQKNMTAAQRYEKFKRNYK